MTFINKSRSEAQEHCRQRPLSPPQGFFGPSKAQAKISSVHVRQLRSLSFCAYQWQRPQPQCGPFLLEQSGYSEEGVCSKSHKLSHKILCKVTSTVSLSVSRTWVSESLLVSVLLLCGWTTKQSSLQEWMDPSERSLTNWGLAELYNERLGGSLRRGFRVDVCQPWCVQKSYKSAQSQVVTNSVLALIGSILPPLFSLVPLFKIASM